MVTIESLAQQSIKEHEEMKSMLVKMKDQLVNNSIGSIKEFNLAFTSLQHRVQMTDIKLNRMVDKAELPTTTRQLLERRRSLQEEVLGKLKETLVPANKIKSLLGSEMQSIRKGRTALSGYHTNSKKQGRIVSNSY